MAKGLIGSAVLFLLSCRQITANIEKNPELPFDYLLIFNLFIVFLVSLALNSIVHFFHRSLLTDLKKITDPSIFALIERANDPFQKTTSFFSLIFIQGLLVWSFCSRAFLIDNMLLLFTVSSIVSLGLCIFSHYVRTLYIRAMETEETDSDP
jgi:hypothetical protein